MQQFEPRDSTVLLLFAWKQEVSIDVRSYRIIHMNQIK